MVKVVLDQESHCLRVSMTVEEERQFKTDADKLGVSVQKMLQASLDDHAAKLFPNIVKPRTAPLR